MKRIVVGVDGSERAARVLREAGALASAIGARLIVKRVVTIPAGMPVEAMSLEPSGIPARLTELAQHELKSLLENNPVGPVLEAADVEIGTAWQVLCDTAREVAADLIVIGTHGYTLLDHVLGTTAARVVNHAPCSVVVVREPKPATK